VTVWGRGLGDSQGSSSISIGGVDAPVYVWKNATGPAADMYSKHGMQMISFLVPSGTPSGSQEIQVTVNGVATNSLPFTVRSQGAIYYSARLARQASERRSSPTKAPSTSAQSFRS
jgi:uncharacterized protein (TIGR03437 family)